MECATVVQKQKQTALMKDVKELMITKYLLFLATWNIAQNEK